MTFRPRVFAYSLTFAFVIAMLLTGSPQKAIAGGTVNRLQSLELVGETSIGGIVDTSGTLVGNEARPSEDQSDTLDPLRSGANVPTPTAPIVPGGPNPTPQTRAATNPGLTGFNGLNHRDQRNAGTGIYFNTQFSLEPPDQALCVGRGFVMESVNTALAVRKPDGTLLAGPTAINQFFGLRPEINRTTGVRGDFTSDPKCYYDQDTNRWFLTLLQEDPAPSVRTHTLIGVSKTGDPTGAWYSLRFDTTDDGLNGTPNHAGCPCLGDQPLIGADHYGFYVSTNEFIAPNGAFQGVQLYAMSKWSLARGVLPTVVHIDDLGVLDGTDVSVQPATTPTHRGDSDGNSNMDEESENGTEFFLSGQYAFNDQNLIAAWALTNTQSLSSASPNLTLHQSPMTTLQYSLPISVRQKDGPRPLGGAQRPPRIAQNDFRMAQVVYANGRLWASLGTRLQPTNDNNIPGGRRDGVLWFSVKPSLDDNTFKATLKGQAYVSLNNASLSYPSVGVNSRGQAVVAFSIVGLDEYPSVGYASIDEKKGTGDVHVAVTGAGPADGFTGYPPNGAIERWGDYSAAVADEDGNIWFAAEYISGAPRTVSANWATWIGKLTLPRGGKGNGND